MKITLIANVSANGKVLLTENPNYHEPREALTYFIQYGNRIGNIIFGRKTFNMLDGGIGNAKRAFPNAEVVIISKSTNQIGNYKVTDSPEKVIGYLKEKGFSEILVGGGAGIYNLFLEAELATDIIFNYIPIIVGDGGVLGHSETLAAQFKIVEHKLLTPEILQVHYTRK